MNEREIEPMLGTWEEVYKKGLLSFWILLQLHDQPSYPYTMDREIEEISQGSMSVDGNSIYRALGRFEDMGLVDSEYRNSESGPDRRYYHLTEKGQHLLEEFIRRNILVFRTPEIGERMEAVLKSDG